MCGFRKDYYCRTGSKLNTFKFRVSCIDSAVYRFVKSIYLSTSPKHYVSFLSGLKHLSRVLGVCLSVRVIAFYHETMSARVALVISALFLGKIFCYLASVSLLLTFVSFFRFVLSPQIYFPRPVKSGTIRSSSPTLTGFDHTLPHRVVLYIYCSASSMVSMR